MPEPQHPTPDSPQPNWWRKVSWIRISQAVLYVLLAANVVSVHLERRYYFLAGEPLRYWRSRLEPLLDEMRRLLFWHDVNWFTIKACFLAGLFTLGAIFVAAGWKKKRALMGSLVVFAAVLVHQFLFTIGLG